MLSALAQGKSLGKQQASLPKPIKVLPGADVPCHGIPAILFHGFITPMLVAPTVAWKSKIEGVCRTAGHVHKKSKLLAVKYRIVLHLIARLSKA
jgi:hypothetical protein